MREIGGRTSADRRRAGPEPFVGAPAWHGTYQQTPSKTVVFFWPLGLDVVKGTRARARQGNSVPVPAGGRKLRHTFVSTPCMRVEITGMKDARGPDRRHQVSPTKDQGAQHAARDRTCTPMAQRHPLRVHLGRVPTRVGDAAAIMLLCPGMTVPAGIHLGGEPNLVFEACLRRAR